MPCFRHYTPITHSKLHINQYAQIFVCGHYLFQEANSYSRMKLKNGTSFEKRIVSKTKLMSVTYIFVPKSMGLLFLQYVLQDMQF